MERESFRKAALASSLQPHGKYLEGPFGRGNWIALSYIKWETCTDCHTYRLEKGLRTLERKRRQRGIRDKCRRKRRREGGRKWREGKKG